MAEFIVGTKTSLGYEGDDFACGVKKERIVRCRDCKQNYQPFPDGSTIPCPWSKSIDGFCAWGEGRD